MMGHIKESQLNIRGFCSEKIESKEYGMSLILVPVADRPECAYALQAAFELADRLGGDVTGCHIRPHRYSRVTLPAALSGAAEWDAAMRGKNPEKMSRSAKKLFADFAGRFGFTVASKPRSDGRPVAVWHERVGSPGKVIPIVGPMSDLLVVSRPARKGGRVASLFLMEALLNSCRPVLVLPQKKVAVGRHLLIAWNQAPEVSKAVAMSMDILCAAEQVTIVTAGEEKAVGPKSSHLVRYLKHHGVDASVIRTRGRHTEKELLGAYRDCGADVLLMGGYSRHRLREQLFGGVTDYMLRRANIPVLFYHG
jgi:nucleotide-binding universal stress UspA family protein